MYQVFVFQLVFNLFFISSAYIVDDLIVQLPEGKIQGHVLKGLGNVNYYAFQEIPYAAPPLKDNRFKEPKEPVPWDGVLDTTDNRKICLQNVQWTVSDVPLNQTEDCLYLNVFTPVNPVSDIETRLPVMVWIHGGGYAGGSGTFYSTGPKWFMNYGIVVVTINYRLGPIGFLTTEDEVIPGNLGLKDQRHALRWVNKNIALFGGDPDKVTIAGESAGGFSVSFQLLSRNNGLFRGAIQQSGSAICRASYTTNGKYYSYELAKILDPNFTDLNSTQDLLEVLQKTSGEDIIEMCSQVQNINGKTASFLGDIIWGAVLEKEGDSADPFVTEPMHESFMKGGYTQVPILVGFNSEEAIGFMGGANCSFGPDYDADPTLMVSAKLNIATENYQTFAEQLTKIYTNSSFTTNLGACVMYSSDAGFDIPIIRQAEVTSKYAPSYLYQFSYEGTLGNHYPNGIRPSIPGAGRVAHAEDLHYFWEFGYSGDIPTEDLLTVRRLHIMWTNFVKYLNPTPEPDPVLGNVTWPSVTENNIQYLNINNTLEVSTDPRAYKAVNELFQKYIRPPYYSY